VTGVTRPRVTGVIRVDRRVRRRSRRSKVLVVRRLIRICSFVWIVLVSATVLTAGAAFASGSAETGSFAAHGLGARKPTRLLAPRTGVFALDVLPASVNLRQWAVTPGNQGQVGSCVAWAIDYSMLGWYSRFGGRAGQPFAPMYTYSQINGGYDNGSDPTAALQLAMTQGSDTRADYTQGDYNWRTKPTAAEHANAANWKIKGYDTLFTSANQLGSAPAMKHALATNHPVAIVIAVRHGFDVLGANPAAVDNDSTSEVRGYHEVLALGYDSAGLVIENSWGTDWANGGFGRLSWSVVQKDVWQAQTIQGFVPLPPAPPTPPTVTTPSVSLVATGPGPGAGGASVVSYKVTWKGTVGTSGAIDHFDAWYQVDGGALVRVPISSPTATSFTLAAHVGHPYRVAVRASSATKVGVVRYSAQFTPKIAP
jgi:hypothetical protein